MGSKGNDMSHRFKRQQQTTINNAAPRSCCCYLLFPVVFANPHPITVVWTDMHGVPATPLHRQSNYNTPLYHVFIISLFARAVSWDTARDFLDRTTYWTYSCAMERGTRIPYVTFSRRFHAWYFLTDCTDFTDAARRVRHWIWARRPVPTAKLCTQTLRTFTAQLYVQYVVLSKKCTCYIFTPKIWSIKKNMIPLQSQMPIWLSW